MFGLIVWTEEGRPLVRLRRETLCGAPFLVLETRGAGRRTARRAVRAAAEMERLGVRRCVLPENWPAAWRGGLLPVEEAPLRRVLLPRLLERLCRERDLDPSGATALLSAPFPDRDVWAAADLLGRRCRRLILSVPGGEALARDLLRRLGLCVLPPGCRPDLQVCFGDPQPDAPAVLLGPDCVRQPVHYRLPEAAETALAPVLAGRGIPSGLVCALWECGAVRREEIGVKSLG